MYLASMHDPMILLNFVIIVVVTFVGALALSAIIDLFRHWRK